MSRIPNREALRNSVASPDLQAWLDSLTDDSWLSRNEGPIALREQGFDVSSATLASMATRGGGPPYRLFLGIARYRWGDLRQWAESRSMYRGGTPLSSETVAPHPYNHARQSEQCGPGGNLRRAPRVAL